MQKLYQINMIQGRSKDDYVVYTEAPEIFKFAETVESGWGATLPEDWNIPEEYKDYPEDYTFSEALFENSVEPEFPIILMGTCDVWNY